MCVDLFESGGFVLSDLQLNVIYGLIWWVVLNNMVSIIIDCLYCEKFGWLEQIWFNVGMIFYIVDVFLFYVKIIDDIVDVQCGDGMVFLIVFEYICFVYFDGSDMLFCYLFEWGLVVVQLLWVVYCFIGDVMILVCGYLVMVCYFDYLQGWLIGGIFDVGLGDWYDIGLKLFGEVQFISCVFIGMVVWYVDLLVMEGIVCVFG